MIILIIKRLNEVIYLAPKLLDETHVNTCKRHKTWILQEFGPMLQGHEVNSSLLDGFFILQNRNPYKISFVLLLVLLTNKPSKHLHFFCFETKKIGKLASEMHGQERFNNSCLFSIARCKLRLFERRTEHPSLR